MNTIYCARIPAPGDVLRLEVIDLNVENSNGTFAKTSAGEATVTNVETRQEQVWNPVLKAQESVDQIVATLSLNGKLYVREVSVGRATDHAPRGYYRETVPAE